MQDTHGLPLYAIREGARTRWLRRSVSLSGLMIAATFWALLTPLWLVASAAADWLRPGLTALRGSLFVAWLLGCEIYGVVSASWLWLRWRLGGVASGARHDAYLTANFALQCRWAGAIWRGVEKLFDVQLSSDGDPGREPMLLMLRHTSMADTLLPVILISAPDRTRLRYVMKRELLWGPSLDIVGQRLPNAFVARNSGDASREIATVVSLLENLRPDEGVLIYPEGTRFSPAARSRVIEKLRAEGKEEAAARAEAFTHVLPPRSGGPVALLAANPGLPVVFCAHTGLHRIRSVTQVWNGTLRDAHVRVRFWHFPASEVPLGEVAQRDWLFEQWQRLDRWLSDQEETP